MADYRRGGQFNNRKRRYRDDDFEDRRPQRRRYEEPLHVTLRKQVLSIAESPVRRTEDDVANIAKAVADNYFDSDLTSIFLDLVVQLTVEQPLKIPFIAAVVLLINVQKPEFTTEVLKKVGDALQKQLEMGSWREVKLYLRFLGCLQGLFGGEGIFGILDELFLRAVDLQTESSEDSLGLELVKVILLSIPYTLASSAIGFESQASTLLEKTDIIASTPHTLENLVEPYPPMQQGELTASQSALALLQKHMQEEARNGWELACLPRPWKVERPSEEDDPLLAAQKHPFPEITVPAKVQMGPRPIFPEIYFSVYTEQDIETVPPASDPASLLVRDALTDTINILDYNRNVTAKFLIDLDCYFAPNTFVKRATAFDKLRDTAGDRTTWKPEDVVVDAAFAQIFQLPTPEHKLVYYHSVLTEACKIAPAAVAPSLGRAIRYLYRNIDRMDMELAMRFLDWFAHHLSNFGFTWKWTEWVDDVELPNIHPKKAFIIAALDKEIRLSFAQRIKGTLPEPYQALITEAKAKDTPDFKFDDENTPFSAHGKALAQLVRKKASDEEYEEIMTGIENEAAQAGLHNPQSFAIDALVTSICYIGSKSLSHLLACIERAKERLMTIAAYSDANKQQIITSVTDYWRDQPGIAVNILDKLLNYNILTPASIIEWALIEHVNRGTSLAEAWIYELVSGTMTKVANRVRAVVHAVRKPGLPDDQKEMLTSTLEQQMAEMKALFGMIEDATRSVRDGSNDQMMENSDRLREEEEGLVRMWGAKWVRVFQRKAAVEENWVKEELLKPIPEPELVEVKMQGEQQESGVGTGVNGNEHGQGRSDERGNERNGMQFEDGDGIE